MHNVCWGGIQLLVTNVMNIENCSVQKLCSYLLPVFTGNLKTSASFCVGLIQSSRKFTRKDLCALLFVI